MNSDLPQNENNSLPLVQETEHIKKFGVVIPISTLSSINSPRHLPSPLTVCISHSLCGFALVAHLQRQKDSCHSAVLRTQTTDVTCRCSNNLHSKCPFPDMLLSTYRENHPEKKTDNKNTYSLSFWTVSQSLPLPPLLPKMTFLDF